MKKFFLLLSAFVVGFGIASSEVSFAIGNPNPVKAVKPVKMSPSALTSGECKGLGGKVVENTKCSAGAECYTTDSEHVIHHTCLTKM